MERPSHIIFDTQSHHYPRRMSLLGLAVAVQLTIIWAFLHGLSVGSFHVGPGTIHIDKIDTPKTKALPPPLVTDSKVDIPKIKPVVFTIASPDKNTAVTVAPQTGPTMTTATTGMATVAGPDQAPVAVRGTHTIPPYPPIERRLGLEGTVTLRLTVREDGRVAAAEVVTSSGHDELDQTARQWILAHWAYKPALKAGAPVPSQAMASVAFSLKNP